MTHEENMAAIIAEIGQHPLAECQKDFDWLIVCTPKAASLFLEMASAGWTTEKIYREVVSNSQLPAAITEEDTGEHRTIMCAADYAVRMIGTWRRGE